MYTGLLLSVRFCSFLSHLHDRFLRPLPTPSYDLTCNHDTHYQLTIVVSFCAPYYDGVLPLSDFLHKTGQGLSVGVIEKPKENGSVEKIARGWWAAEEGKVMAHH